MKVWISRDNDEFGEICIWDNCPGTQEYGSWCSDAATAFIGLIEVDEARRLLGCMPRKGSRKQYELTLKGMPK